MLASKPSGLPCRQAWTQFFADELVCIGGSGQEYSVDKVARQLEELAAESGHMLLFLRSVQSLRVLRWAAGAEAPQLLHTCSIQVHHRTLTIRTSFCAIIQMLHPGCALPHLEDSALLLRLLPWCSLILMPIQVHHRTLKMQTCFCAAFKMLL